MPGQRSRSDGGPHTCSSSSNQGLTSHIRSHIIHAWSHIRSHTYRSIKMAWSHIRSHIPRSLGHTSGHTHLGHLVTHPVTHILVTWSHIQITWSHAHPPSPLSQHAHTPQATKTHCTCTHKTTSASSPPCHTSHITQHTSHITQHTGRTQPCTLPTCSARRTQP